MQTVSESTPCRGSRTYVTWSLAGQAATLTDLRAKLIEDMAHAAVGLGKTFIDQVLAIPEDVDLSQCPPPRASKNPFTRLAKAEEKSESEKAWCVVVYFLISRLWGLTRNVTVQGRAQRAPRDLLGGKAEKADRQCRSAQ